MSDELTRPLGLKKPRKRSPPVPALYAGIALTCFVLGGAGTFLWFGVGSSPEAEAPPRSPSPLAARDLPGPADNRPQIASGPAEEPSAGTRFADAPDLDPLSPAAPDGEIEPEAVPPPFRRQEQGLAHLPDPDLVERGAAGVIPKRSADGSRPMDVYSRPPATQGNFGVARIALIVGGIGISQTGSQNAVRELPAAVTLAFAPYGNSLGRWMQEARKAGHELLLQIPMEPYDHPGNNPGPHTLLSDVTPEENLANLHWAMSRITNYVGVINFLGGRFVAHAEALKPIFDEFARRGLLFVDDGSIKNTMTEVTAGTSLLPYARAQIHIDAVRSRRDIAARLDELVKQARRTGLAIGVANAFPDSIDMIAEFARNADRLGVEITPISAVVSDPERKRK